MSIRPKQARWFETFVARDQTVYALEALARTGVVQLELDPRLTAPMDLRRVRDKLRQFETLMGSYKDLLADCEFCPTAFEGSPVRIATAALHQLRAWTARVEHVRDLLADLRHERKDLLLLQEALLALGDDGQALQPIAHHTDFLFKGAFACPPGQRLRPSPDTAVWDVYPGIEHDFVIVAALPEQADAAKGFLEEQVCEPVVIPPWLGAATNELRTNLRTHLDRVDERIAELEGQLESLRRDPEMAEALANVSTLRWYLENAPSLATQQRLCHVSGWTTAQDSRQLQAALNNARITAVVRFPEPPVAASPPVESLASRWSSPFRLFVNMWGTPGRAEVDPSALLPVIVPLLFGYMFPDIGQGLVLALLALALSRRFPAVRFLIPCGIAAMLFGLLFGEFFALEGVVEPVWLRPLDYPLQVLFIPLLFGAGLMLLGLVFAGFEAAWRGELLDWVLLDAAVLVLYASTLVAIFFPPAVVGIGVALGWFVLGALVLSRRSRLPNIGAALAHLVHSVFDLALNTVSFLRVGAFALAHAGLSAAVFALAQRVESTVLFIAVLVLGNAIAMALEGLVVFVQTTRLVLFEFFLRFLKADGRVFRPLNRPTAIR